MAVPPERLPARNEPARGTEVAAWLLLKPSPEEEHALDHLRDPACTLASGNGDVLYDGRIHSHPPRDRDRRRDHPRHSGPQSRLIAWTRETPARRGSRGSLVRQPAELGRDAREQYFPTTSSRRSGSMGFRSQPAAPIDRAFSSARWSAVHTTTGTGARAASFNCSSRNCQPFMTGM